MGQSIFNSLGSNYSIKFVSTSLYSILGSRKSDIQKLEKKILFDYFGKYKLVSGKAEILTLHKGRDAIQAACTVLLNKGDQVITQAFSCYAVEEGILRAGMKPIYVDISQESTNLSVDNLDKVFKKNPQAKAVLIQHSLGIPADTVSIRNWCNDNGVLLFEDIAQSIGGFDKEGKQLGVSADAVIFSFGRDKIIDAISGGAVVFRNSNPEISEKISYLKSSVGKISFVYVYEDLIYPDITSFIRRTHHFILGKVILKIVKSVGLLGSPIKSKTDDLTFMHPAYAKLSLLQFKGLEHQIKHRKEMALEYYKLLEESGLKFLATKNQLNSASNLRFSIRCSDEKQVSKLVKALKKNNIYVSDRWYRKAVDCGSFECKSTYQKASCPNAELLATQVINLPTHREMNLKKVHRICKVINKALGK